MTKPIVYTTPTCQFCKMVKAFFHEKGIEFEEKNVAEDQALLKEMVDASGQLGVPVTIIGDQVVVGFDKKTLEELTKEEN